MDLSCYVAHQYSIGCPAWDLQIASSHTTTKIAQVLSLEIFLRMRTCACISVAVEQKEFEFIFVQLSCNYLRGTCLFSELHAFLCSFLHLRHLVPLFCGVLSSCFVKGHYGARMQCQFNVDNLCSYIRAYQSIHSWYSVHDIVLTSLQI